MKARESFLGDSKDKLGNTMLISDSLCEEGGRGNLVGTIGEGAQDL